MQLVGQDDEFGGILELNRWAGDFIGSKVSSVFRNAITTNPAAKTFHLIHSLSNLVFYHGFDRQAYKEQSNNSVASITARSLNLCSTPKYHKRIGKGVKTSMDVTFSYVAPGMPDLPIPGDTLKVSEWSLEKKTPFPLWKKQSYRHCQSEICCHSEEKDPLTWEFSSWQVACDGDQASPWHQDLLRLLHHNLEILLHRKEFHDRPPQAVFICTVCTVQYLSSDCTHSYLWMQM